MAEPNGESWHETELSTASRGLRLLGSILLLAFVLLVLASVEPELVYAPFGLIVLGLFFALLTHDVHFILRTGVKWNATGIRQTGTLFRRRMHDWNDLSSVLPNMHKRATVLTFKGRGQVRVYWGMKAHRDILDLANRKLTDARIT